MKENVGRVLTLANVLTEKVKMVQVLTEALESQVESMKGGER